MPVHPGRWRTGSEGAKTPSLPASGIGTEQLLDILREPCHKAVIFSDTLPQLVEKIGAVLVAKQQIKLIGKYPCGFSFLPVLDHTVENRIEGD